MNGFENGTAAPIPLMFKRGDTVPNNPDLPVLFYSEALPKPFDDPAALFEAMFASQGWPPQWRDGIDSYHHYHTQGHEVLGVASGDAQLMLGGEHGQVLNVSTGDVLLLPAGTGHCSLSASKDFLVVGAYPPGQHADICREAPTPAQLRNIEQLTFPDEGPVTGDQRAFRRLWVRDC